MIRILAFMLAALVVLLPVGAAAAGVDVTVTKSTYALGEQVSYTITNDSAERIYMNGFPYALVVSYATELHLDPCVVLPTVSSIAPGGSEMYAWGQTDCFTGFTVPAGMYRVEVDYWTDTIPAASAIAPFCVDSGCTFATPVQDDVRSAPWGVVKGAYR